jgi:general secretion pathway protein H
MDKPAGKAKTLMLVAGNNVISTLKRCESFAAPRAGAPASGRLRGVPSGFTLIELMVVITMIAIATAGVSFALRDGQAAVLDKEAERLAVVLETARVQSRSTGVALAWLPVPQGFVVLPAAQLNGSTVQIDAKAVRAWLAPEVNAQIVGAESKAERGVLLGAEPMIPPSAVVLRLGERRLRVATDGLRPFSVQTIEEVAKP